MTAMAGREREIAELHDLVLRGQVGAGSCLLMTGPPGIGKTRLMFETERYGCEAGLTVVSGRATELDQAVPLRTLSTVLKPLGVAVDAGGEGAEDRRLKIIDDIGGALAERAAERPIMVILDDIQWTDEFSALALGFLVPALASTAVTWLLGGRPAVRDSPIGRIIDRLVADGVARLVVKPLSTDAMHELCRELVGAPLDSALIANVAKLDGNPFFAVEMIRSLVKSDRVAVVDGRAVVNSYEVLPDFVAAVRLRLRGLTSLAGRILEVSSVLNRPMMLHEASRLVDTPLSAIALASDELVASGIMVAHGAELQFSHDLWREAIYDGLSEPVRAGLHDEAAALARDEGRSPLEIAEHLVRSQRHGSEEIVRYLEDAADTLAARAPDTAANLYLRAMNTLDQDDDRWPVLVARATNLLTFTGRVSEAHRLGEAALQARSLSPDIEASLLLALAESFKHEGNNAAAVAYAERALSLPLNDGMRATVLAVQAHARLYVDGGAGADAAGDEADRLGRSSGEYSASVLGTVARSVVARSDGRLDDALEYAWDAVDTADQHRGGALHRHPRLWLGDAMLAVDQLAEAAEVYAAAQRESQRFGTAWTQPMWHFKHAVLLMAMARLDEAVAEAEAGVGLAHYMTTRQLCVPLHSLLASIAVLRGALPTARDHLRQMTRLQAEGITATPELISWPAALLHDAEGKPARAVAALAAVYDAFPKRSLLLSFDPTCGPTMVRMALQAGDRVRARLTYAAMRSLARRNPMVPSLRGAAVHAEGLLAQNAQTLAHAVEILRSSPRPLLRANALESVAVAVAPEDRSRALDYAQEAIQICVEAGAQQTVNRLTGVLGLAHPRPATEGGHRLLGLTPTEDLVARLVADGLTNHAIARRLGKSPHTVDSHLRKIFTKFGVNSRAALATEVTKRLNGPPGSGPTTSWHTVGSP